MAEGGLQIGIGVDLITERAPGQYGNWRWWPSAKGMTIPSGARSASPAIG